MTGPTQWDLQVRPEMASQLLSHSISKAEGIFSVCTGFTVTVSVYLWLLSALSLSILEKCLSEMRALQLVLETPGTIALQLSVDLLETGKVPLVPNGPCVVLESTHSSCGHHLGK